MSPTSYQTALPRVGLDLQGQYSAMRLRMSFWTG
jgi:hypothetical protein